jgi:hypothetical protein
MKSGSWSSLVALRERRADQALAESRRAGRDRQQAVERLDAATQAFDRDEARRTVQRRATYDSMAGRALSVAEMTNLRDRIHASAVESQSGQAHVLQLTEQSRAAAEAAEQADSAHNERRRAVEKADSIQRRLALEQSRKSEVQGEIDLEDVVVMSAAHSRMASKRNAG